VGIVPKDDVEIMEVAARRSHDHDVVDRSGAIFHRPAAFTADFCHSWPNA
jgi:hypothetical protein